MHRLIDDKPFDDCKVPEEYSNLYGMKYNQIPVNENTRILISEDLYTAFLKGLGISSRAYEDNAACSPVRILPDLMEIDTDGRLMLHETDKKAFRKVSMGRMISRTEKLPVYFITSQKWEELGKVKLPSFGGLVEFIYEIGNKHATEACDRSMHYLMNDSEKDLHESFRGLVQLMEDLEDYVMKMMRKRERIFLYYRALDLVDTRIHSLFGMMEAFNTFLNGELRQVKEKGKD